MPPRHLALVGALCVLAGWLLASTLAPPVARLQSRPPDRKPAAAPPPIIAFTEQLHRRLQEPAPAPASRRNPFSFAEPAREAASETPAPAAPTLMPAEPLAVAIGPSYVLSGIGISGDVRTAVLTTTGEDVHVVRVDDEIGGYRVADIAAAEVTLVKGAERHVLRFVP